MDDKEVRFERMRPDQVETCREKADVALLPLGSLEWHGHHAPLGMDALHARHLCHAAVRKLGGGAVFPALVWGLPRDSFLVGTNSDTAETAARAYGTETERVTGFSSHGGLDTQDQWLFYQRLLRMSLEQIAGFGFHSIYIWTGHGPLINFIRPAALAFSRASRMAGQTVTVDWGNKIVTSGIGWKHGGDLETSLVMAVDAESVDLDAGQKNPEIEAGDATREKGEELTETISSDIAREARWLVDNYPELPARNVLRKQE